MISAKEAKIKTQETIDKYVGLNVIEELITEAILNGKFGIYCKGDLNYKTCEQLRTLGYTIRFECLDYEPFFFVTWE